jgi:protein TonB
MLTDKQIFLYCGILSLSFHLVAGGMFYTNKPSLRQSIKSSTPTIQVTLIDLGNTATEIAVEKKVQKETHHSVVKQFPPVVASEMTAPEAITPPEPLQKVSRHVAKLLSPQRELSQQKPEEQLQLQLQLQQHLETPPSPEPVAVELPEEPFNQQTVGAGFEEHTAFIEHYSEKGESSSRSDKHAVSDIVSEKPSEGDLSGDQDHVIDPVYLGFIRGMIEKHIDYPARARRLRMAGKVNLSFKITATGAIDEINILAESPYPILNNAAILAVKSAAPFPQPRRKINVELPILFSLNRS